MLTPGDEIGLIIDLNGVPGVSASKVDITITNLSDSFYTVHDLITLPTGQVCQGEGEWLVQQDSTGAQPLADFAEFEIAARATVISPGAVQIVNPGKGGITSGVETVDINYQNMINFTQSSFDSNNGQLIVKYGNQTALR